MVAKNRDGPKSTVRTQLLRLFFDSKRWAMKRLSGLGWTGPRAKSGSGLDSFRGACIILYYVGHRIALVWYGTLPYL
eukprot:scaffold190_cov171-Amphora_coffeaeformis.AAC.16